MSTTRSEAIWTGTLKEGSGTMKVASGYFEGPYTFATRFEGGAKGTNPEELIGAAHAGCYSMFLSALLTNNGTPPARVHTTATVHLTAGPTISKIELNCEAEVPGLDADRFPGAGARGQSQMPGLQGAGGSRRGRAERNAAVACPIRRHSPILRTGEPVSGVLRKGRLAIYVVHNSHAKAPRTQKNTA